MSLSAEKAGEGAPGVAPGEGHGVADRHQRLVRRTVLVSLLTLASRVIGFAREVLSAALFGAASPVYDAFITAWRVPNLFRRLLGEGALSTSLQTALTEVDADRGNAAGSRMFLDTLRLVGGILLGLSVVVMAGVALLPDEMPLTGWRWLGKDPAPVRELTVRLMPFVIVICLAALCSGALQVRGHFRAPNLAPLAMNVVWVGSLVWVGFAFGWQSKAPAGSAEEFELHLRMSRVLAYGALLAGTLQLVVQIPALVRAGLLAGRNVQRAAELSRSSWSVLRRSMPLAFGAAVYQVNVMVDGLMAEGLLRDGGPTAHYYATRVQQFPLALIAVAATSAVFPSLKALGHLGRRNELRKLHDRAQIAVCYLALPASAGLFALAGPVSAVLFQHGAYGADGVGRVADALRMLSLAVLPAGAVGLASRAFYSCGDFRTPVLVASVALVLNAGLNAVFVLGLEMDTGGLALATALSSWGNLALLLPGLRVRLGLPPGGSGARGMLVRMTLAAGAAGAAAFWAQRGAARVLVAAGEDPARSVGALLVALLAGLGGYFLAARGLRLPSLRELRARS